MLEETTNTLSKDLGKRQVIEAPHPNSAKRSLSGTAKRKRWANPLSRGLVGYDVKRVQNEMRRRCLEGLLGTVLARVRIDYKLSIRKRLDEK